MYLPSHLIPSPNQSSRSRRYIELLDEGAAKALALLDAATGLYGEVGEQPDPSWRNRGRNERKTIRTLPHQYFYKL